jgi:hypothetical protein
MDPLYRNGWLVFERADGSERRRLNQVPDDWASLPSERLALLCAVAAPAMAIKRPITGQQPVWPHQDAESSPEG